jgi:hypothetical protein
MTPAGLEPAIPGSVGRCLIHWATGPIRSVAPRLRSTVGTRMRRRGAVPALTPAHQPCIRRANPYPPPDARSQSWAQPPVALLCSARARASPKPDACPARLLLRPHPHNWNRCPNLTFVLPSWCSGTNHARSAHWKLHPQRVHVAASSSHLLRFPHKFAVAPSHWAHGVVVSHPLSMREALGSIPSVSIV